MRNLYNFVDFYQSHPDIFHAMSGESEFTDILQSDCKISNQGKTSDKHFADTDCKISYQAYLVTLRNHPARIEQGGSRLV